MSDDPKKCATHLLSDSPTKEDKFGHSSIAFAIADLVTTESGAKCIGLTGTWGAGKSSVVEILRERLSELEHGNSETFVFDAWAHQGDPLRRSFLEQLLDRLAVIGWLEHANYWKEKKDELARRVQITTTTSEPQLTPLGGAFAASLLLLPLGYQLFVKYADATDTTKIFYALIGKVLIALPFLLVAAAWLCWRPTVKLWKSTFWTKHRKPHEKKSLLALFLNKSHERVESNTIRTPDPTSVEFQQIFGELISEALQPPARKLVVVVDNLDRVDAKDALAIWATLKTFFDFDTLANAPCLKRLWLLLPFDEVAIRRLWSDTSREQPGDANASPYNSDDLGQAFIDKTFQVTFRVSPPVLSDWHDFLTRQLKEAFPNHGNEDFHKVYRIYDMSAVRASRPPTPREIKIFVNRIGAIHRRWLDEIALPVQAFYVVLSMNNGNLAEELALRSDEQILKSVPIDMVGTEFRASLAAIHFNVSKNRALQVVIGGQLKECLARGDEEKIKQLAALPGFTSVLEKQMEENSHNWIRGETGSLAIAASTLAKAPEADDSSWNSTWTMLTSGARAVTRWSRFDEQVADGIIQIVKRSPREPLVEPVIKAVSNSFPRKENTPSIEQIDTWLRGVLVLVRTLGTEHASVIEHHLKVAAEPEGYIHVMKSVRGDGQWQGYIRFLQPRSGIQDILREIGSLVEQGKFDDTFYQCTQTMRQVKITWPWQQLVGSIQQRLQTAPLETHEVKALATTLLSFESTVSEAHISLGNLSEAGFMTLHLYHASGDDEAVALLMLPLLEATSAGTSIGNVNANSQAGLVVYNQILGTPDQRQAVVEAFAGLVVKYQKIDLLYEAPRQVPSCAPFVYAVLRHLAGGENSSQCIPPTKIVECKVYLRAALGDSRFETLVAHTAKDASLAAALSANAFDLQQVDLYRAVLKAAPQGPAYFSFLVSGLQAVGQSIWESALSSESEPMDLMIEVKEAGYGPDLGIEFEDALVVHAGQVLEGTSKVDSLQPRWNAVFEGLKTGLRLAALKRILELVCTASAPTDSLLQLYGQLLSSPDVLEQSEERVALHAFTPFIERLRVIELRWCCTVLECNPNFLIELGDSTRQDLEARIIAAAAQQTIGEEIRGAIEALAKLANVNLTKTQPATEASSAPSDTNS